jgi:predicted Zn-dependent protease
MRFLTIILLCLPLHALAHSDAHERMEYLDAQLLSEPDNAELHLRRGRLYIEESHFEEARADLEKTLALAPTQHGARYFLVEALLYGGKAELAEQQAQQFIDAHGAQELGALSRGYWLLGQARLARQHPEAAIAAYRRALKVTVEPTPDHYQLFVNACLAARGKYLDEALRVLDQGLAAGGSIDLLQGMALEIELQAGRTDAALQRLESVIAQEKRLPFLYTRKAGILADAGRMTEAGKALASARGALTAIPGKRRRAQAYTDLERQIAALGTRVGLQESVAR